MVTLEATSHPMGDLPGHLFPGLLFFLWGFWWLWRTAGRDRRSALMPVVVHPMEPWLRIVLPIIGIIGESRWWRWPITLGSLTTMQHAAMYTAFLLTGITDVLALRGRVEPTASRVSLAGAFGLTGYLFVAHGGHSHLTMTVHTILGAILIATGLVHVCEAFMPHRTAWAWLRAFGAMLAGTWFWQVGWMLYVAHYDPADPAVVLRAHFFFAVHALLLAAVVLVVSQIHRPGSGRASLG